MDSLRQLKRLSRSELRCLKRVAKQWCKDCFGTLTVAAIVASCTFGFSQAGDEPLDPLHASTDQLASKQSSAKQTNREQANREQANREQPGREHSNERAEGDFNAKGYRFQRYRAPLIDNVPGGTVVHAAEVRELIDQQQPALIDVLSVTLRTEAIDFGISWLPDKPRSNIPGSIWLPNVGRAGLEPFMVEFFRDNLKRKTNGNKHHPIIFYCIADCWMSWNAVKRAAEWGYSNIYWFPEGTDGWIAAGGKLMSAEPESIIDYIRAAGNQ